MANQLDPKGHLADTAREIAREDIPPIEDKSKLGKADAQNQLDQAKKALEEAAAKTDAEEIKKKLEEVGAEVKLK